MALVKDYAEQIRGVSYKPDDLHNTLNAGSITLLRANNINDGALCFNDVVYVDRSRVKDEQKLKKGDILVCTSSGSKNLVGKAAYIPDDIDMTFGAFCKVIRPHNIEPAFLQYFFQSPSYRQCISDLAAGANINNIRNEHIDEMSFHLPDLPTQRRIAATLDKVSEGIDLCRKMLADLDVLVKSQFVEMFGDVKTNDKSWEAKPLKELCEISRGGSPRPIANYLGGTIPWIKIGDATDGDNIYINSTKEHIVEEGVKKSRYVKSGSLIFANCGVSLGFCRIINIDGCIHDGWLALQDIDPSLNKVFLLMTINQLTDYFRSIAPGATQPNLNTEIMGNYQQIIPPLKLQEEYLEFVKRIDKSKFAVQQQLAELETLKKSLMQEYFG